MTCTIKIEDRQKLDLPGRRSTEIVSADCGAVSSTLRYVEIEPGPSARGPHVHLGFEEVIYVLEGQGCLKSDSGTFDLAAGDTALVSSGERHMTLNTGDGVLKLLCAFPVADIRPGTREFAGWDDG